MSWETVLTSVISSGFVGALFTWVFQHKVEGFKDELERNRTVESKVWQMKRDACLRALNVANAVLSNYEYESVPKGDITPQCESVENVRACFNELACTCASSEVLDQLKKILCESPPPDAIVDLRNAVRKELGFSTEEIDNDRQNAFVARVKCDPRSMQGVWQICTSWRLESVAQDSTDADELSMAHKDKGLVESTEVSLPLMPQ